MSDDNPSKINGLGVDPMQRLASFKPPRDYSLGAAKPNKKVFTPNLNVTRNRNKGSTSNNTRDSKKDDKGKRERRSDRNKNIRNGPKVIKSAGVFSEGLGGGERQYNRSSYGGREGSDSAHVTLQRPTIRVKDVIKIDKELEEQKIKMVMSRCTLDDAELEDFQQGSDNETPVRLPMDDIGWSKNKAGSGVQVKKEVIVKPDPDAPDGSTPVPQTDTKPLGVKMEPFDDADVVDLLLSENPALLLIKLPDTLPGRGASDEDAPTRRRAPAFLVSRNTEPSSSVEAKDENTSTDNRCCLRQLEEGRIGKLVVRRSGRVSLRLGEATFEVSLGTKSAFHQEVVCVGSNPASRSARIVSLGPLQHKLTVVPDWQAGLLNAPC